MPDDKATTATEPNPAFDAIFSFNRNAFGNWARNMAKLSHEMAQFMQARLNEEAAMWEKLAACRDAAEIMQCQSEFAARTGTDYAAASQKLSRLMLDFAKSYSLDTADQPRETD